MANMLLSPTIGSYSGLQSSLADVEETQRKPSSREWSSYSKQKSPKKEKKMISPILRESIKEPNNRPMSRSLTSPEIVLRKRSPRSDTDLNLSFTRRSYDQTGCNGNYHTRLHYMLLPWRRIPQQNSRQWCTQGGE